MDKHLSAPSSGPHEVQNQARLQTIRAVLGKELLDASRDRRALLTSLLMPLLFAIVTLGSSHFILHSQTQSSDFTLTVLHPERAVPLMQHLQQAGIKIKPHYLEPRHILEQQQADMVLVVPETFSETFRQQKPAPITLYWDQSRIELQPTMYRLKGLIQQWGGSIGGLRLIARGVSPEVSQAIKIHEVNVSPEQKLAVKILGGLPMIIVMIAFMSGIGIASDMAAGERERRSLEPLLITPSKPHELFIGKWLAALSLTLGFSLLGVALQIWAVNMAPLEQLGLAVTLNVQSYLQIILVLLPLMMLATSLQLLLSLLAKSFKDAQNYNSLLILLPVVPGFYSMFASSGLTQWKLFVPILGPQTLIVEIIGGEPLPVAAWVICCLANLGAAILIAWMASRLLRRESIINLN